MLAAHFSLTWFQKVTLRMTCLMDHSKMNNSTLRSMFVCVCASMSVRLSFWSLRHKQTSWNRFKTSLWVTSIKPFASYYFKSNYWLVWLSRTKKKSNNKNRIEKKIKICWENDSCNCCKCQDFFSSNWA